MIPGLCLGVVLVLLPGCRGRRPPAQGMARAAEESVRAPWAAGKFYPADAAALRRDVESFLGEAKSRPLPGRIIALVAPHAGYPYSGRVAGTAFAPVRGASYDLVIIIGPSHHVPVRGAALTDAGVWRTPLGDVAVDRPACEALARAWPQAAVEPGAFEQEHSAEVELPFLQVALEPGFKILPALMTDYSMANCKAFAGALVKVAAGKRALLVASSDLSHYPPYGEAQKSDKAALAALLTMDAARVEQACRALENKGVAGLVTAMCGEGPVKVVMLAAKALGANRAVLLGSANSGDADPARRGEVVGYGAVALVGPMKAEEKPMDRPHQAHETGLTDAHRKRLLQIAREAVERYIKEGAAPAVEETDPVLTRKSGAFVTLWEQGQLRGCIGMIEAREPLYLTVRDMAIAAAAEDHRFPPVSASELDQIRIAVSVLSPTWRVKDASEIVVGKHGVIVKQGWRSGVFLPEVPVEQKWTCEQMLDNLCVHKAGLPRDAWKKGAELYCFTSEAFEEPGPKHGEK